MVQLYKIQWDCGNMNILQHSGHAHWGHIADKNGAVLDILPKYPSGHSHSQLQLQIYLEKMVLTKQTDVLLSCRACVELMAVARFFTTEYKISGRVVTVGRNTFLYCEREHGITT